MTNQIQINHYKNQYTSWSVGGDVTRTNAPGNIVPCVTSPTGYCRVTNTSTKDGKEWYLNTLTTKQDIEQAQQQLQVDSQKAQQSINKQGKELFWNGCMSSGFVGAGCQSYFVFGGKDPFTNKPLSNPERITLGAGLAVQAVGAGYNSIGSKAVNKAEKQAIKAEQTILNNPKKNVLDNIATSESAIKASKFTPDYLRKEAQVDVSNIFNGTRSYLKVGQNNFKVDIKESNKSNTTKEHCKPSALSLPVA